MRRGSPRIRIASACVAFSLLGALACSAASTADGGEEQTGEAETGEGSSDTGEAFDDAACSVRLAWEAGAGDLSSFPTYELLQADESRPTGQRVEVRAADFPRLNDYGNYTPQLELALGALDGFGTSADIFAGFAAPIAGNLPPTSASGNADDLGGFVVIPAEGEAYLVPAQFELTDDDRTLLAHPLFTLPARSQVALYLKTSFAAPEGDCLGASPSMRELLGDTSADPSGASSAALDALVDLGVVESGNGLAWLQAYVVASADRESEAVAAYIAQKPEGDFELRDQACTTGVTFNFCTATLSASNFRDDQGRLAIDVDDVQAAADWDLKVYSWLPVDGAGPWPTLLYGHGLTGDGMQGEALADWAAPAGMAVVAIDAIKHGEHPSLEGESLAGLAALLEFFAADVAAGNIDALELRDNFRQSTFDKLHLVRALVAGADLDGDGNSDVLPDKLNYHGTSLGAIMGVELMSLTDAFQAGVLVMPGGRLTSVMTDPMGSFDDVLSVLIPSSFTPGDTRRLFAMVQTVLDAADPVTYAPAVLQSRDDAVPQRPDLLMGAVLGDTTIPNSSNWAAARALGLDIVPPVLEPVVGMGATTSAPVSSNAFDGASTTGMLEFDIIEPGVAATHNNMAFSEVGLTAWMAFHSSVFDTGEGVIIDPYAELGIDHP